VDEHQYNADLVKLAANGDEAAFGILYSRLGSVSVWNGVSNDE